MVGKKNIFKRVTPANNITKRLIGTKKICFPVSNKSLCPFINTPERACLENQFFTHFYYVASRVPISKSIAGKKDISKRTIGNNNISKRMIGTRKRCFPVVIKKCRLFDYHGVKKQFCLYFILQKCWGLD